MSHHWDEFSKSLAEKSIPRRESLRLLGAALAGALLSPLGEVSAWASGSDPCKAFCRRCRNKSYQNACLAACGACVGDTNRLCGTCGSYVCCAQPSPYENGACIDGHCEYWCAEGATDCSGTCTDLLLDPNNCGACGHVCQAPTPYCAWGACSECPAGHIKCNGMCVDPSTNALHCGGCGQACPIGHICFLGSCCNPTIACCFIDGCGL